MNLDVSPRVLFATLNLLLVGLLANTNLTMLVLCFLNCLGLDIKLSNLIILLILACSSFATLSGIASSSSISSLNLFSSLIASWIKLVEISILLSQISFKISAITSSLLITSTVRNGSPKPVGISVNFLSPKLYSCKFSLLEICQP